MALLLLSSSSFTSRSWCFGLALGIFFVIFLIQASMSLYYFLPTPSDLFIKIPSPVYVICYLFFTIELIVEKTGSPFTWKDITLIVSQSKYFSYGYVFHKRVKRSIPIAALYQVFCYGMLFVYIWYFSYKNTYKYGCCYVCSSSFWNPRVAIRNEFWID